MQGIKGALPIKRKHAYRRILPLLTLAAFASLTLTLLIPHPAYAGILGDFLDIPGMIKNWLLDITSLTFNLYFGIINKTLEADFIGGSFSVLFGTDEPYRVIEGIYQSAVIPIAQAILGLFMLMQLIKISQKIDATSTLPAVKEIVFLVVSYCIMSWFINNALEVMSAIYDLFNSLVGAVADKSQSSSWTTTAIKFTDDEASQATIGGCVMLLFLGLASVFVGLTAYAVAMVVALARSIQLYVYAALSPIPISLAGFEETKQVTIGFFKNFAAAALAGVIMMLVLYIYPHMVSSLVVDSGGLAQDELLKLAVGGTGTEVFDCIGAILKWAATSIVVIIGLGKSGGWAKEVLGA